MMSSPLRFLSFGALLAGSALLPVNVIAQLSFPSHQIAQSSNALNIVAHGDFNGDGRDDLVVRTFQTPPAAPQLYLSNGDGTYQAPISLPANFLAAGDFNQDGKLDFVAPGPSGSQLKIYLGNGNGTFQAPKTFGDSTASGEFTQAVTAANVNNDSRTDLVQIVQPTAGGNSALQVWISNGNGTFTAGQRIANVLSPQTMLAGDFDGDGKSDLAIVYADKGATSVQVWYGDGTGHFGSPFNITDPHNYDNAGITVADVNNDGRSDLIGPAFIYGVSNTSQLQKKFMLFSGNSNRTLSYSNIATDQCPATVAVADVNGDGVNDLLFSEGACSFDSNTDFVVMPGTGNGKFAAAQTVFQNSYMIGTPYAVRSTTGTKPDVALSESTGPNDDPSTSPPSALVLLTNESSGTFPGCGVTSMAEGIRICTPGASASSPIQFSIGAAGPTPMRTAAVWADGKKVKEQLTHAFSNYSFLDASVPLSAGTHAITIFGTGWDNTLQKKSFTLTVSGGACSAPGSPGVHVCTPANGATVSSPVAIQAAATITGTLARMEVWVDGVKKYTETSSKTLSTSLSVAAGTHRFGIFAVNTAGTKWEGVVNATVK